MLRKLSMARCPVLSGGNAANGNQMSPERERTGTSNWVSESWITENSHSKLTCGEVKDCQQLTAQPANQRQGSALVKSGSPQGMLQVGKELSKNQCTVYACP